MTKIIELLFSNPKITGGVDRFLSLTAKDAKGNPASGLLILLYIVNRRLKPTTIRNFSARAKIDGKWVKMESILIPDNFSIPGTRTQFSQARLYDIAGLNLLEYGKGVHGWLLFMFPEAIGKDKVNGSIIRIEMRDAFDKKHHVKGKLEFQISGTPDDRYFPGSGMQQA